MTDNTGNNGRDERGRFGKGNAGRPPLSTNKIQAAIREKLGQFIEGKLDNIEEIYQKLPDREKGKFLLEAISYFMPKMREVIMEVTPGENGTDLSTWNESDLRELIRLHEKYQTNGAN
jgi:hypothetical protein